jgi:hypothetical protein
MGDGHSLRARWLSPAGAVTARLIAGRSIQELDANQTRAGRMLIAEFRNRLRMMRGHYEDNVFNPRDYRTTGGVELAELAAEVIGAGQQRCS